MQQLSHQCFVALTRPPMRFGVTVNFLLMNGLLNMALFFTFHRIGLPFIAFFILAGLIHVLGMIACHYDARFFDIALGKTALATCKNKTIWGCRSYEPY